MCGAHFLQHDCLPGGVTIAHGQAGLFLLSGAVPALPVAIPWLANHDDLSLSSSRPTYFDPCHVLPPPAVPVYQHTAKVFCFLNKIYKDAPPPQILAGQQLQSNIFFGQRKSARALSVVAYLGASSNQTSCAGDMVIRLLLLPHQLRFSTDNRVS